MISFVIIGRNEGWKLTKCFESVVSTIKFNNLKDAEVIYVDSNSTDDSIERAKQFPDVKVFKITRDYNAAVARNIGVKKSKNDILCFVDGDMELIKEFISYILNKNNELIYPFVGGFLIDKIYIDNYQLSEINEYPSNMKHPIVMAFTGGAFLISRNYWEQIGGMKDYLLGGADPDLALRLAKIGLLKLWIDKPMVIHNETKHEKTYQIINLFTKRSAVGRIVVYRENLLNVYSLKRLFRMEYGSLILILILLCFPFNLTLSVSLLFIYLSLLLLKTILKRKSLNTFLYLLIKDIVFIGLIFYFPSKKINPIYERIF